MTEKPTPKTNTELFGHEQTETMLLHDLAAGKLAHGLIFAGVRGIGKATLAYRFARSLLSGKNDMNLPESDPVFRRIAAGSHTDLSVIEPAYDAKKDEYANEISVDQARTIAQSLALTPAEGQWRAVIIDSADNLNTNSANSILKILEEPPPQTILILIAHNANALLPTIRSRCRLITIKPLSDSDFKKGLRLSEPDMGEEEIKMLSVISGNSIGVALELKEQGAAAFYEEILYLMSSAESLDNMQVFKFCEQFGGGKKAHKIWLLFTHLVLLAIERTAKHCSGAEVAWVSEEERGAIKKLASLHNAGIWAKKWQDTSNQLALTKNLHLDYKQVALTFFHSLASEEEFCFS